MLVREVIAGEGLLSGKEVLGAPGALQRLGDIGLIVVAVGVAQLRQALRVALARHNGLADGHTGRPSAMTDHLGEREVHLFQGLVPRLEMVGGGGKEPLPVTQGAAQHAHLVSGSNGASEPPLAVQALSPLAIQPIGCGPAGGARGLAGIKQEHLPAPGLHKRKQRHPVAPCRCHGDGGHATVKEPVGEGVAVGGARTKTAHGLRVAMWGHGDPVLGCADVDPRGVGVADLERVGEHGGWREQRSGGTRVKAIVFVRCPSGLQTEERGRKSAVGAGVTEQQAVSHTGSGQRLSPVMGSPTPETNLTYGHMAPMRGRSRRPTGCQLREQKTHGLALFLMYVRWRSRRGP